MRRRIKRRLFLMSMALAAGASGHSFAQGGKNLPGEGHHSGGPYPDTALPLPENGSGGGTPSSNLLAQVKQALADLAYGADTRTASAAARGWRLELLQPEPAAGLGGDFRGGKSRPVGVALRVTF